MRFAKPIFSVALIVLLDTPCSAHDPHQLSVSVRHQETLPSEEDDFVSAGGIPAGVRQSLQSILIREQIWDSRYVTFCFGPQQELEARKDLVNKIISIASEWEQGTGLKMDFGSPTPRKCSNIGSANVRIDVHDPGKDGGLFTSLIGNDAEKHGIDGYGFFSTLLLFPSEDPYYQKEDVKRFYILHEIGHALGASHEHQRIDCKYDFTYIAKSFNFSYEKEAKDNMEKLFATQRHAYPDGKAILTSTSVETKFDNYSVMKYNLSTDSDVSGDDPKVYLQGIHSPCYRAGWVSGLSEYDKAGMRLAYQAPAFAVAALITTLSAKSGFNALPAETKKRLSDPNLGRDQIAEIVKLNALNLVSTPNTEAIIKELRTLQTSEPAIDAVKSALGKRSD